MTLSLHLHLTLLSDATFGRGDGIAGLVDEEVEYDPDTGLPFIRGRTLKGLLVEECANILYSLGSIAASDLLKEFEAAARFLFGQGGSVAGDQAHLHIGAATLPASIVDAVKADKLLPSDVLESLTAIRRQTAVNEKTGAPADGSLRSMRVVLREMVLIAPLDFDEDPDQATLALLGAVTLGLHRAGTERNRGRGRLQARLFDVDDEKTPEYFAVFKLLLPGDSL